jgi:nucleoside-diphosphate-sugar epimerase
MRCVVTGGSGFIGSHLCEALARAGHDVTSIDLKARTFQGDAFCWRPRAHPVIQHCMGDVRGPDAAWHLSHADVIYHLAAQRSVQRSIEDPRGSVSWNVECMLAVLGAARPGTRIVAASSSSVYGPNHEGRACRERDPLVPCSPYAASKVACEALCESWHRSFGASIVSLRYFNVYGPGQDPAGEYAAVIPRFMKAALSDKAATLYGGEQSRSFTYVSDVVRATQLAGEWNHARPGDAPAVHQVLNVGNPETTSIRRLARQISEVSPNPLTVEVAPPRSGEAEVTLPNLELTWEVLGWRPLVTLADGLRAVRDSMQCAGNDDSPAVESLLAFAE